MSWLICHRCGAACDVEYPLVRCERGCPPYDVPADAVFAQPGPHGKAGECQCCPAPRVNATHCARHLEQRRVRERERASLRRLAAAASLALCLTPHVAQAGSHAVERAVLRAEAAAARAGRAADWAVGSAARAQRQARRAESILHAMQRPAGWAAAGEPVTLAAVDEPALARLAPLSVADSARCPVVTELPPVPAGRAAAMTCGMLARWREGLVPALIAALNRASGLPDDAAAADALAADPVASCWLNRSLRLVRDNGASVRAVIRGCFDGIESGEDHRLWAAEDAV